MSRKILKVLISILFLIVAAVAAILSIKSFFPELLEQQKEKYGVGPIFETHAHKTPAFKKDEKEVKPVVVTPSRPVQLQRPPYRNDMSRAYGVEPVRREPGKYGVAPVNKLGLYTADVESKYGVAPVQRPPYREQGEKYGVSPVRGRDASLEPAKYGVGPIYKYNEQSNKN